MVERICPHCQHGNPLDNRFCGQCGAPLERTNTTTDIVQSQQPGLPVLSSINVPPELRHMGKAIAVGLAALAAEAGMAWIRRRIEHLNHPSQPMHQHMYPVVQSQPVVHSYHAGQPYHVTQGYPVATQSAPPVTRTVAPTPNGAATVVSQRIVQVWEDGVLKRQAVERTHWRREDG